MNRLNSSGPLILLGGGGHGRVLLAALKSQDCLSQLAGVVDPNPGELDAEQFGVPIMRAESELDTLFGGQLVELVNGLGSTAKTDPRKDLFLQMKQAGYRFASILHSSAICVDDEPTLGEGVQLMAGTIIQTGVRLGDNVLINTGAQVDHDCQIEDHVHIAPGAILSGQVRVGEGSHIGCGATVIQNIRIGAGALIAAGAVVVRDVPAGARVAGVPGVEVA